MKKFVLIVALVLMPFAASAQKMGNPPPSPHLAPLMQAVINQARPKISKEFVSGMILTAATSQGNTSVFMARATPALEAKIRAAGLGNAQLQRMFVDIFAKRMCRKGEATRMFIDMGGQISFALRDQAKRLLMGGNITKC